MNLLNHAKFKYSYIIMLCTFLLAAASVAPAQQKPLPLTGDERALAGQINYLFRRAVEQVRPAVVSLIVTKKNDPSDFPGLRFFEPEESVGLGSGCIIDKRGYIITNHHVAADNDRIEVILADGRRFIAQEKMLDPDTDLAMVRIDPEGEDLPVAQFGDSDQVEVGDFVLAIGRPFNLPQTVTMGIVSYRGRQTGILGRWGYEDFIQTDADINKGNSGGPLVSLYGEIVGINSNILTLSPTGISAGYGFSIPSNLAKIVSEQLIENKKVIRGWLGVNMIGLEDARDIPEDQINASLENRGARRALGRIPAAIEKGIWITSVVENSPADTAGLEQFDVVLSMDDKVYDTSRELRDYIATLAPGTIAQFKVWRDGKEFEVDVTLGDRGLARQEEEKALLAARERMFELRQKEATKEEQQEPAKLGIYVSYLTPDTAQQLGYEKDTEGIYIVEVKAKSLAEVAGLRPGDIIISVEGVPIKSPEQLVEIVKKADLKKGIRVTIQNKEGRKICIIRSDPIQI